MTQKEIEKKLGVSRSYIKCTGVKAVAEFIEPTTMVELLYLGAGISIIICPLKIVLKKKAVKANLLVLTAFCLCFYNFNCFSPTHYATPQ